MGFGMTSFPFLAICRASRPFFYIMEKQIPMESSSHVHSGSTVQEPPLSELFCLISPHQLFIMSGDAAVAGAHQTQRQETLMWQAACLGLDSWAVSDDTSWGIPYPSIWCGYPKMPPTLCALQVPLILTLTQTKPLHHLLFFPLLKMCNHICLFMCMCEREGNKEQAGRKWEERSECNLFTHEVGFMDPLCRW